jgi:hypothetical protein
MCDGLLVLVLAGGEQHFLLLVGGRLPVQVGARLMLLQLHLVDIGLLLVGLLVVVVGLVMLLHLHLHVGG